MSGNQVEETPAQSEQLQRRGTVRSAFYSVFSWSPIEVERRLGIAPLENTRTKTTGSAENSPPGTAENKAAVTKENRVSVTKENRVSVTKENKAPETRARVTIKEYEKNPMISEKADRRLSDYRDTKEIQALIKERKESKSKKAQKEKRSSKPLQDFRDEDEVIEYIKAMRESKEAEKQRRESEKKNSKDSKKSRTSSKNITKIWSDYRDDKELVEQRSSVKSRDSKMTKRSSHHPSVGTETQSKELNRNESKNSRKSVDTPRNSSKMLTRGSRDYKDDKDFIAQRSSILKGSKLKERSELAGNQDQDKRENSDVD